ncbi:exopolysaccharide biosynthesis protein [Rhizorhabdus dicambivorans]|uniref:Exopolysaccharide biosynthesis protein exod n=1 Tax=Rhizorhabdus dicambivorans TaxID=1850238 RepID=A0A2A4FP98_9SPHN|nr:exopolysaccharide biosynthesis protein [Rhizorhabdus dicambivorans]ATE65450.1 hypothetical protein CMV14_14430 [Rhizorhabdus dicambivorans]PCE40585.1 hypothetical protein COO09_19195 [Rhizorhabdus dicambivorans]
MSTSPQIATTARDACAVSPSSDTLLTDTLEVLASGCAGDCISIDDVTSALGSKCFAGLLFLLAAPNIFPTPPFVDIALSIPLMILSAQLAFGVRRPWLPAWLLRREVATERFAAIAGRLSPVSRRVETVLKRRIAPLTGILGHRLIGLACLALAIMLALPIPFGNALPGAAIALFALGLLNRDGIAVLAGVAATLASGGVAAGLGYGAFRIGEWIAEALSFPI